MPRFTSRLHIVRAAFAMALFGASAAAVAQPPTPSAGETKAREAFQNGKLDDALKLLQDAAKANPMLVPKVTVSRWLLEANQGLQARQWLERAAADDPAHPAVLLMNARYALNEGRITDGILSSDAALGGAASPRWDAETRKTFQRDARLLLIAGYDRRGDNASARAHLVALLEADPKNPRYRVQLARVHFLTNRPEDAFTELTTARKDDPTLDPPELTMAQLWAEKPDFAKADEWYGKAARAHPTVANVHRGYAGYLLDRGRLDAAKAPVEAAIKIDPTARDTKALIGLAARYAKDYAAATAAFEELARDHPNYVFATANLSLVLAESADANRKRRAIELAEVYVRQNPKLPEAHAVHGYALLKNDRLADAERALLTAASHGSLSPDAAYFLARVFHQKEQFEDAQKLLKDALAAQGAFVFRGDAQALLNEVEKRVPAKKP